MLFHNCYQDLSTDTEVSLLATIVVMDVVEDIYLIVLNYFWLHLISWKEFSISYVKFFNLARFSYCLNTKSSSGAIILNCAYWIQPHKAIATYSYAKYTNVCSYSYSHIQYVYGICTLAYVPVQCTCTAATCTCIYMYCKIW